jgi:hypothetical protein
MLCRCRKAEESWRPGRADRRDGGSSGAVNGSGSSRSMMLSACRSTSR